MLLLMAADPMLKVNTGPSPKLAIEFIFFFAKILAKEK